MTLERPTLTLIDGSSYIFRAYHAIPHLSTSRGVPTNAVYGFTLMLLKALREDNPTHVAIAFEKEGRSFRQAIDPQYKANRPDAPSDLVPQFALIREVVEALNVPVVEVPGYEADDVIATLTRDAVEKGFRVLVITGDKDFMQLVGEHVELYDSMADRRTGAAEVEERLGVKPEQVIDYMSLIGDPIDNIPGVPKVGPKTAAQLIQKFGNLDALLARLDELPISGLRGAKGIAEQLRTHREQLERARKLVTLQEHLDLAVSPESLARRSMDEVAVRRLFGQLEFSRLLRELPPPRVASTGPARPKLVLTEEELNQFADQLAAAPIVALRTLSEGPRPRVEPLVGLGFAFGEGKVFYIPLLHRYLGVPRQLDRAMVAARLKPFLEDPNKPKVGHDLKADYLALKQTGVTLRGIAFDVELASYLLNAARREHALADLARERLSCELPGDVRLASGKSRPASDTLVEEAATFVGACADAALVLSGKLRPEIEEQGLRPLLEQIELPLLPILAAMELEGVRVDGTALGKIESEVSQLLRQQEQEIFRLAGHEFNVNSNPQLATVLFEELKLPILRRGKTGPSADQEVLEKLAAEHPLPRAVLDYRGLFKLKGTYLDALPTLVERDGRIHTSFHQATTATGRLSSSDPNLQNVPIRSDLGKRVREAFVAEEGSVFISADYSQIELRILAHVSGDEALLGAFERGEDVHTRTAAEVFGVPAELVTPEMRRAAKAINFGIAYGLSAYGLSQRLDLPGSEAKAIIDRYFERYQGVRTWLDATIEKARQQGEVQTLFGRRRYVAEIHSRNPATRQGAERIAVNMPIQGTAADLIKRAMIEVDRRLRKEGLRAQLLLQVHDELLIEAPEAEAEAAKRILVEAMSGAGELKVKLPVEVGVGRSWAEAH
jgi:DNA polymerase-1